jgi:hypothetical protein
MYCENINNGELMREVKLLPRDRTDLRLFDSGLRSTSYMIGPDDWRSDA